VTGKKTKGAKPVAHTADDEQKRERTQAPNFKDHLLAMPQDDGTFERMEAKLRETKF
jgi:hypothetical protein